jgi:hypothetical protein
VSLRSPDGRWEVRQVDDELRIYAVRDGDRDLRARCDMTEAVDVRLRELAGIGIADLIEAYTAVCQWWDGGSSWRSSTRSARSGPVSTYR